MYKYSMSIKLSIFIRVGRIVVFDDSNIRRQNYSNIRTIRILKNQDFILPFKGKIF